MTAIKEIPEVAALDAKINTVVHGELYNQHYKEIQHKFWDAIDAIQKRLSAATHPDVEQLAEEQYKKAIWILQLCERDNQFMSDEERLHLRNAISLLKHAGQSAVQDATPQECQYCCECDLKCSACEEGGYKCTAMFRRDVCPVCSLRSELSVKDEEIKDRKNRESDLHREIDARDKELSAAQEENKRLRETVIKGLQDIKRAAQVNIDEDDVFNAAETMGDALEKSFILTDALLSAIRSPESGEQTK